MNIVILLSGGLDSTCLLHDLVTGASLTGESYVIHPVFVNYGQATVDAEFVACQRVLSYMNEQYPREDRKIAPLIQVSCTVGRTPLKNDEVRYGANHVAYVPYRNMVMLSLALSATEEIHPDAIVMGVHNIDVANHFPDCSGDFAEAVQRVVDLYTGVNHLCAVHFPFCCDEYQTKEDIQREVPKDLLALCFSGYGDTLAAIQTALAPKEFLDGVMADMNAQPKACECACPDCATDTTCALK